jgi:hypothetical protein
MPSSATATGSPAWRPTCSGRPSGAHPGAELDGADLEGADTTDIIVDPAEAEDALNYPTDREGARSTACGWPQETVQPHNARIYL